MRESGLTEITFRLYPSSQPASRAPGMPAGHVCSLVAAALQALPLPERPQDSEIHFGGPQSLMTADPGYTDMAGNTLSTPLLGAECVFGGFACLHSQAG